MPNEDLTPEDVEYVEKYGDEQYYPMPEEKQGIFQFLNKILGLKDTSKGSNLEDTELHKVRLLQEASEYAKMWNLEDVGSYIKKDGEIVLASALSKKGFFINAATIARKDVKLRGDGQKSGKKSSWFKKNVDEGGETQ